MTALNNGALDVSQTVYAASFYKTRYLYVHSIGKTRTPGYVDIPGFDGRTPAFVVKKTGIFQPAKKRTQTPEIRAGFEEIVENLGKEETRTARRSNPASRDTLDNLETFRL